MLDLEKVKEDFVATEGIINCLQMGIIFLRNEKDIKKFTPEMVDDFIETIVGIWKPEGDEKAEKKKKEAVIELEKILPGLQKNIEKYIKEEKKTIGVVKYENAKRIFREWEDFIIEKLRSDLNLDLANPFLTVSVKKNLKAGIDFQLAAKQTRLAVTDWGGIFEGAFAIFNPKVSTFHAGRMDIKLVSTLYDIKSGPNVLNLRDVDGVNKKIDLISKLQNKSFGKFIEVTSYKVGIIYGRWELRNSYMKKIKEGGLVIGPDTWKELTGDEWNAFKFFIWQIRYGVEELNKKWSATDLQKAVKIFLNSFYGDEELLAKAEKDPEFKILKKLISKI